MGPNRTQGAKDYREWSLEPAEWLNTMTQRFKGLTIFLPVALALALLMLLPGAYAEQTTKTIAFPIGALKNAQAGTLYNRTIVFDPPDGVSEVIYSKVILTADIQTTPTKVETWVNGTSCAPSFYNAPQANNYKLQFDCTEAMPGNGVFLAQLNLSENANNFYAEFEITYYNHPNGEMFLSGTEYWVGENGTVFLQLTDSQNLPISNASCVIDVYNPNKTVWINNYPMTFLNTSDGLYYLDLIVPHYTGVYMLSARCAYDAIIYSFNPVSMGYDGTLRTESDDPDILIETDCVEIYTDTGFYQNVTFDITGVNISEINEIKLLWVGMINKDGDLQIFNHDTSSWENLHDLTKTGIPECFKREYITGSVYSNVSDYIQGTNISGRVYLDAIEAILSDRFTLELHNNGSIVSDVRGSGEIHVHSADITSNSSRFDDVELLINSLANLTAGEVWAFPYRNLSYVDWALGSAFVWNYTSREITGGNLSVMDWATTSDLSGLATQDNTTSIYDLVLGLNNLSDFDVWSYASRTLTSYGSLVSDVWSYEPRSVNCTANVTSNCSVFVEGKCPVIIKRTVCSN